MLEAFYIHPTMSAVDGCAKAGQLRRALEIFRQMQREGVPPNKITCHALFNGFLQQGEVLLAREVLQYMIKAGYRLASPCTRMRSIETLLKRIHISLKSQLIHI